MAAVWRTFSACRSRWMAWWGETTDIVFLNSPWVKRPFGRGFRIAWMLITLICVASQPDIGAMFLFVSEIKTIFLIFTWYFWVASLWSLGNSSWESLSALDWSVFEQVRHGSSKSAGHVAWSQWDAFTGCIAISHKVVNINSCLVLN